MKDAYGANILLRANYKAYEDMLRYTNEGKSEIVGAIASTGSAITNGAKYKRNKPIGSPSNISSKNCSRGSKYGMGIVEESTV